MRLAVLLFTKRMPFIHLCSACWMPTACSQHFQPEPVKAMGWSGHTFMTEPDMSGRSGNSKGGFVGVPLASLILQVYH